MPWKVLPMSDIRLVFVHQIRSLGKSVASTCREFGVSRNTAYKWLARFDHDPATPLADRSRRPHSSPTRTASDTEHLILDLRDRFGWGPRKIRSRLLHTGHPMPSIRTCASILKRHNRLQPPMPAPSEELLRFERPAANQLWQCDFKSPLEVGRRRITPFTVLDDHSRFLLALRGCTDLNARNAWQILWETFDQYGLPEEILCDNFFGCHTAPPLPSISWFESRLLRLGIRCIHGRPYHPQTQGKIERLHGTLERELWPRVRRGALDHFNADCEQWRTPIYNLLRPHEALGDLPPCSRYRPSARKRPQRFPELCYPEGSLLRKVSSVGDIRWHYYRILVGRGVGGEVVRLQETESEIQVFYAQSLIRRIALTDLKPNTFL